MQDGREDLAHLSSGAARELELAQRRLEQLEALCVVDASLELRRMA